jgi:hypothetical protein
MIAWFVVLTVVVVGIALVIWGIVSITMPRRPRDFDARDLNARDGAFSGNVAVGSDLTVGSTSNLANTLIQTLAIPPYHANDLNVTLDGTYTTIALTNQSGDAATALLPSAKDNPGKCIVLLNLTANPNFNVAPQGTDVLDGSSTPVSLTGAAIFVSAGAGPSALGEWKKLL